jgi:hypothetical protein
VLGTWLRRRAATRPCPACGWEIRVEAVKCRYCGSPVGPVPPAEGRVCWLCRIAAGVSVLVLLGGVIAFVVHSGGP